MWDHDYCIVCDKQCAQDAVYCSDTCRQLELRNSSSPGQPEVGRTESTDSSMSTVSVLMIPQHQHQHQHSQQSHYHYHPSSKSQSSLRLSPPLLAATQCPDLVASSPDEELVEDYFSTRTAGPLRPDSVGGYKQKSESFLYESPMLVPQGQQALSPPPSPLLMPSSNYYRSGPEKPAMASVNYRRWLAAS